MTKVAIVTDQHFGARGDSVKILDHYEKFYSNVFLPYVFENNITTVFDLGDSLDKRKNTAHTTWCRAAKMFYDPLNEAGITLHSIVGNHNMPFKQEITDNSAQMLIGSYKRFKVYQVPTEIEIAGTKIALIPWICKENARDVLTLIKNTKAKICFGHLELTGFVMYKGMPACREGIDRKTFKKFDTVLTGHFHHKSSDGNIHYLGAPYEITWNDYNDPRGFHIFDTDTQELEFIQNPYKLFNIIEYDENIDQTDIINTFKDTYVKVIVNHKTDELNYSKFRDTLDSANAIDIKVIDKTQIKQIDIDETIETQDQYEIINTYIDKLETECDKTAIKDLMITLYNEAMYQQ